MTTEGAIIQEIRKRPFIRPLLFWIFGILLQMLFPLQAVSIVFPIMVAVMVVVSFFVQKTELPKFQTQWAWGVIFAILTVFLAIQVTALTEIRLSRQSATGALLLKAHDVQNYMVEKLNALRLPDMDKSVLATITVNYKKAMSWELRRSFSIVGVSHLLAVSGFHVGIVCAFVNLMLSFLPKRQTVFRWIKFLLTILCVWAFAYISGLSTAAVRAATMISIYMTSVVFRRKPDKYNTLACAAFLMLVYNPFYLFDVGFLLSFSAVFFILYIHPRLSRLIEVRNPLIAAPWNVLTITLAAQAGTSFLCFYYFGQVSAVFLFTNLFLSLLATVLIPATLLWMILPAGISGTGVLQLMIETLTKSMMWIVERFASLPYSSVSVKFDFFTLVSSYICLGLFLLYAQTRRFRMLLYALAALLAILCWHIFV